MDPAASLSVLQSYSKIMCASRDTCGATWRPVTLTFTVCSTDFPPTPDLLSYLTHPQLHPRSSAPLERNELQKIHSTPIHRKCQNLPDPKHCPFEKAWLNLKKQDLILNNLPCSTSPVGVNKGFPLSCWNEEEMETICQVSLMPKSLQVPRGASTWEK